MPVNPSLKNGYLSIANELVDFLAKTNIPGNEMRILWIVIRQTWGWSLGGRKKDWDDISYSQFEKKTGMNRRNVGRSIKSLVAKRLLLKNGENSYKINQNYEEWLVAKRLLVGANMVSGRGKRGQKLVAKRLPTKDNTKETIQKTVEAKTPQARFLESFAGLYENQTGHQFKADKKHFVIIANLIKKYGYEATVEKAKILAVYCQQAEVWFCKGGWADFTPEKLSSQWNSIIPTLTEEQKKEKKYRETFQKAEEERKRTDELLKASANT